jgi:hypothetical protein
MIKLVNTYSLMWDPSMSSVRLGKGMEENLHWTRMISNPRPSAQKTSALLYAIKS